MAQVTDYTVSNQTFPNTRADLNNIFAAIATNNSGTTAPSNQQAGQWWIDTTSSTWILYIHDGTDDIQFATIDTSANTVNFTDSALDVVTDTTPQLGGDLDLNSNDITGTGNINITGTATVTGLTTTGDINFGDNDKAVFGAGSDLQIYHDGVNSRIDDTGTGSLIIKGSTFVRVTGQSNGYTLADFVDTTGESKLFHQSNLKLATTSTGIDVTGTVVSDGLTVDTDTLKVDSANNRVGIGTSSPLRVLDIATTTGGTIIHMTDDATGHLATDGVDIQQEGTLLQILNREAGDIRLGTNNTERMRIDSSGNVLIGGTDSSYVSNGGIQLNGSSGDKLYGMRHTGTTSGTHIADWNTGIASGGLGTGNFLRLTDGGNLRFQFKGDGNATCDGSFSGGGADYAEYFEWTDGNSNNEDRIGLSVVLDNGKIREATASDTNIIGVVSANPTVVGDEQPHHWQDKFIRDDFGRIQYETLTCWKWEIEDENGKTTDGYIEGRTDKDIPENATNVESFEHSYEMINPNYDETLEYIPRSQRQEWSCVGLMGKLRIKKGQQTNSNWIKIRDISDTVEEWLIK